MLSEKPENRSLSPEPNKPGACFDALRLWQEGLYGPAGTLRHKPAESNQLAFAEVPYPADEATASRDKASDHGKDDWTVAVNISSEARIRGVDARAVKLNKQLLALSDKTRGSSATLLIQVVTDRQEENGRAIERYVVRDGKIKRLEDVASKGAACDLKNLLALASKNYSSGRIALIQHSHGHGNAGFTGETGKLSMDEFAAAISNGLSGKHLDALNLDSCSMAQNGVLEKLEPVAANVVAAQIIESVDNEIRVGQDIGLWLEALLADTKMDGAALCKLAVKKEHDHTAPEQSGARTLSAFNMSAYREFRQALDKFGDCLTAAITEPSKAKVLQQIFEDSSGIEWSEYKFDLGRVTRGVREAVKQGKLDDPDGRLNQACNELRKQASFLVMDNQEHEQTKKWWGELNGLNVFIPDGEMAFDDDKRHYLTDTLRFIREPLHLDDPNSVIEQSEWLRYPLKDLQRVAEDFEKLTRGSAVHAELKCFNDGCRQLDVVDFKDKQQVKQVLDSLMAMACQIEASPVFASIQQRAAREYNDSMLLQGSGGWRNFQRLWRNLIEQD